MQWINRIPIWIVYERTERSRKKGALEHSNWMNIIRPSFCLWKHVSELIRTITLAQTHIYQPLYPVEWLNGSSTDLRTSSFIRATISHQMTLYCQLSILMRLQRQCTPQSSHTHSLPESNSHTWCLTKPKGTKRKMKNNLFQFTLLIWINYGIPFSLLMCRCRFGLG